MTHHRIVYITTSDKESAQKIASTLLEERLIACANILPEMNSVYRWKGEVCNDSETVLILKTKEELVSKIKERVPQLHSYECPCLLVLPVNDGLPAYLSWLDAQTEAST